MILVFGGTTEGRKAVEELEDAGNTFYYSTRFGDQDIPLVHGIALSGAMTGEQMTAFCRSHAIRLVVDAAHPFAAHLHRTIAKVTVELNLPAIRFERIFPKHYDARIEWCEYYDEFIKSVAATDVRKILVTTGVQSIEKLRTIKNVELFYRILRKPSSIDLAHRMGVDDSHLCYYGEETDRQLFDRLRPDLILVKDSGESGGFSGKVQAALDCGVRVVAVKRPPTPASFVVVNGPHGLRRMVERLLPDFYPLRSGLTTGTYATACSVGAATRLLTGEMPTQVNVALPNGETIGVDVAYGDNYCYAMKDAGDDPDVTDGLEIRATVERNSGKGIVIKGGIGVGRITLPGFDSGVGEAAINRVPREMIAGNITEQLHPDGGLTVVISVPDGERVAQRTFNPRLGIVDGISIVGVSGIVKPFSEESFVASIRKCVEVAKASGSTRIVINSGAKSERFVRTLYPYLPPQAFVEYGNHIGDTLRMAAGQGFEHITLGIMLGKAVKLAAGNLNTHSKKTLMDKSFIKQMLRESGCDDATIAQTDTMTLARELWQIVPDAKIKAFVNVVIAHCLTHCQPIVGDANLEILLIDENGTVHGC